MDTSEVYTKNPYLFHCPELQKKPDENIYGYAFNLELSSAKEPKDPDKVPLIFDSMNLAKNASGTLDSLPNPGRHHEKNFVGFADSHAKSIDSNKL